MWTRKAIRLIFMKRIKPLKVIEEKMKIKAKKLVGIISAFAVLIIVSYTSNMFEVDSSSKLSKIIKDMKATKSYTDMINWQYERLKNPITNKIPDDIRKKELAFSKKLPIKKEAYQYKNNKIKSANWVSEGPNNQGGRTKDIIPDISNPQILIAAAAEGGAWRSIDGGKNWTSVTDPTFIQNVTSIVQDTRGGKTNNWYYGTGEYYANFWPDGNGLGGLLGNGVYKSNDNGQTWVPLVNTQSNSPAYSFHPFQIVWNLDINESNLEQDEIWAACLGGVYGSVDGGETWEYSISGAGDLSEISHFSSVSVTTGGRIYAALGAGINSGIYFTDNKSDWTNITPSFWPASVQRIVITNAPSNDNILYVVATTPGFGIEGEEGDFSSLWRYNNEFGTWTDLSQNLPDYVDPVAGFQTQTGYDVILKVKPDDENFVIIGGTNLYRTTNGFATKLNSDNWIGGYATDNNIDMYINHHPDQHGFFFLPSNPKVVFSAHDGGISKSNDITANLVAWEYLNNGYTTTQFWSVAIDHVSANNGFLSGGLQDNGSYLDMTPNTKSDWRITGGGDGMVTAIADGSTHLYVSSQEGDIYRIDLSENVALVKPAGADNFDFKTPYILDSNNPNVMFLAAGDKVWRNSNLLAIPNGNDEPTSINWEVFNGVVDYQNVTALATTKAKNNLLYVGDNGGQIYKITNAADINSPLENISSSDFPNANISAIATNPNDENCILVSYSNYGVISMFYSNNGGSSWSAVSGNLEEFSDGSGNGPSIRDVKILPVSDGLVYFAATSTGLYSTSTLNGSDTKWNLEAPVEIGNTVVETIDVRPVDGKVVIGTFGKGAFSSKFTTTDIGKDNNEIPNKFILSQNYPNPFNPSTIIKYTIPSIISNSSITSGVKSTEISPFSRNDNMHVTLKIYDVLGKEVATLVNENQLAGNYSVTFDASNLSSGVYLYKLSVDNFIESKKMILTK